MENLDNSFKNRLAYELTPNDLINLQKEFNPNFKDDGECVDGEAMEDAFFDILLQKDSIVVISSDVKKWPLNHNELPIIKSKFKNVLGEKFQEEKIDMMSDKKGDYFVDYKLD